ncbi:unnamed protein product, partial [Brenthis ino]
MSSSHSCISEVIPNFTILFRYLTKEEVQVTCPNVNTMRLSLKEGLDRRFRRIEDDKYCSLATLMDPRYKMIFLHQHRDLHHHPITKTHTTFWSCSEELAAVKLPNVEETKCPIASELDRYLTDVLLPKDLYVHMG